MREKLMDDIQKLVAIEEISNLKARYCRFADEKQWSKLAELFTSDGTMEFYDVEGNLINQLRGHEAIRETISKNVGLAQPIHHVFSREIEVTSTTTANGIWAMEDLVIFPEGANARFQSMHGYGHYNETYVKIDGRWLINSLKLTRFRMEFTYENEGKDKNVNVN